MRLSIHDANAFSFIAFADGWPMTWGKTLLEVDTEQGYACIIVRSEDGQVIPAAQGDEGAMWVDGSWVIVERRRSVVTVKSVTDVHPALRERNAFWHGSVDRAAGRSHWGRAAYAYDYDLQDYYEKGWRLGLT